MAPAAKESTATASNATASAPPSPVLRAGTPITPETTSESNTNISTTTRGQFNFGEALRNVRSKVAAMRTAGSNVPIQVSVIKELDAIIGKLDEYEPSKLSEREPKQITSTTSNTIILDTLSQIQASVVNLEKRYSDIEAKITDAPKTYAEIIKSTSLKESKIEQQTRRRKQRDTLRQERQKYGVTLSLKDTEKPESILAMSAKDIAERCQQAINRLYINIADSPRITGVSKLAKSFRLQFETEEEATTVRKLNQTKDDVWNTAFEGLKIHVPMYGIVVHGIPVANLNSTMMDNAKVLITV
jgi:hypothetical protein